MQALERLSFGGSRIRDTVTAQSKILLFWYFTTYLLLEKNKPKYQQLESPPLDDTTQSKLKLEPLETDTIPTEQVKSEEQTGSTLLDPFNLEGL